MQEEKTVLDEGKNCKYSPNLSLAGLLGRELVWAELASLGIAWL